MKKVAELKIDKMFTALENQFDHGHYQYECKGCHQRFATDWNIYANRMFPYQPRGSYVVCPYCKEIHRDMVGYGKANEYIPYKVTLKVITFKNAVELRVSYEGLAFTKNLFKRTFCDGKEIFRFDLKSGKSTFHVKLTKGKKVEWTVYPIEEGYIQAIERGSILRYFRRNCLANKTHRKGLIGVLRLVREYITNQLEKREKKRLETLYINGLGHDSGMFLLPLFNFANRIENPNGKNYERGRKFKSYITRLYTVEADSIFPKDWVSLLYERMEKGEDEVTALVRSMGLPDRAEVRKLVGEDYHCIGNLKKALALCENFHHGIRLHEAIEVNENTTDFLEILKGMYGEERMVRFAEHKMEYNFKDCRMLYFQLNEENRERLLREKVRSRDLHDWLSMVHKKQKHKNHPLNVPEHIRRRLCMQKDSLQFMVPKESFELLEMGHKLHNCVAGYGERMREGKVCIVAVTDDKGKYLACLEIMGDRIVQAKIDQNKGVKVNAKINQSILEWAKKANLKVETRDIEVMEQGEKKAKKAV